MKFNKAILNITLSTSTLVLFLILIVVSWFYVARTDQSVTKINETLNHVNISVTNFQKNSNHRWNITFEAFSQVAGAIDNVANRLQANQLSNLNLTKFNRAALIDTNIILHKIWENITNQSPCISDPLSQCISTKKSPDLRPPDISHFKPY